MEASELLASDLAGDLLGARLIAKLATYSPDGTIHLIPMWFACEDGAVLMPTSGASRKTRNLRRDARATVMIDDSRGGLDVRGITMVGRVEILSGAEAQAANRRVHLRYVTETGLAFPDVEEALRSDDVTLRFRPERGASWDFAGHPASRVLLESGEFEPLAPVHGRPAKQ
jgi:PPOX class probable F420-dependent enzyme